MMGDSRGLTSAMQLAGGSALLGLQCTNIILINHVIPATKKNISVRSQGNRGLFGHMYEHFKELSWLTNNSKTHSCVWFCMYIASLYLC